jgi:hypothetical protein
VGNQMATIAAVPRYLAVRRAPMDLKPRVGENAASAADLKFLHHLRQARLGTSNRKAALES